MLTTAAFRELALSFPETVESSHLETPDFRVAGKIFATLREEHGQAVVKLTPEDQSLHIETAPGTLEPVKGSWGRKGWTLVLLDRMDAETARHLLATAWRTVAPKRVVRRHSL